jgi:hypothetical protein
MKNCPFAYRKNGDVSLHCRKLAGEKGGDFCAHQYLCNITRKWEVSPQGKRCPVRGKD